MHQSEMTNIIPFQPQRVKRRYRKANHAETDADHSKQATFQVAFLKAPRQVQDPRALQELRLLAAVLMRAICDAHGMVGGLSKAQRRVAKEWFRNPDDSPFSFVWICEMLNLKPENVLIQISQIEPAGLSFYSQTIESFIESRYEERDFVYHPPVGFK